MQKGALDRTAYNGVQVQMYAVPTSAKWAPVGEGRKTGSKHRRFNGLRPADDPNLNWHWQMLNGAVLAGTSADQEPDS